MACQLVKETYMEHYLKNRTNMMSCSRSSSSVQGSMQLQYCQIKWRNPNMVDMTIFIYGISVMFADITTSDMPIVINNDVIA